VCARAPFTRYSPLGVDATFSAACVVSRDDVELTCRTGGGVGATVLWTITIAGLSSSNPRTGYRRPVVDRLGVVRLVLHELGVCAVWLWSGH
jgi:hypothetical protein